MSFKPTYTYSIMKGLQHLMEGQYQIYGQIEFMDKVEDTSVINEVSLLYSGTLDQEKGLMVIEPFIRFHVLDEDKSMGTIYKTNERLIYKTPGQGSQYIYDDSHSNSKGLDKPFTDAVNQVLQDLKDQVIDAGNEIITVGKHTYEQKITTKKLTLSLTKEDCISLLDQITYLSKKRMGEDVKTFMEQESFDINLQMYIYQQYIYKITCILENERYRITVTNQLEDYSKTKPILIPEEANGGKNVKGLTPEEIEHMFNEIFDFIG